MASHSAASRSGSMVASFSAESITEARFNAPVTQRTTAMCGAGKVGRAIVCPPLEVARRSTGWTPTGGARGAARPTRRWDGAAAPPLGRRYGRPVTPPGTVLHPAACLTRTGPLGQLHGVL